MNRHLSPTDAARQLGVSPKALRLYEQRGLVRPHRSQAGWRAYGPDEMARAAEIVALRGLGLSLADVGRVLGGDTVGLAAALARHQADLEGRQRRIGAMIGKVRGLRDDLARGRQVDLVALKEPAVAFDLPWPWGGERFVLADIRPLTWITGPLGSGKTRLARTLAAALPGATFLGLDRPAGERTRAAPALAWLTDEGATPSAALVSLLSGLAADGPVVVDMVEQGLDEATQTALAAWLRRRGPEAPPAFLMTRSTAMLDLAELGRDESIILCPANHSVPMLVGPHPGMPGYEAVATCLASPEVRARTEGLVAIRP
ncbi:MAG: MerR family transcriptional regulator [Ferrovibrionaceae bacterium]